MSELPALRVEFERPLRQVGKAAESRRRAELTIHEHALIARIASECDRLDSEATRDAVQTAMEEELGLLSWGMNQADGRAAAAELVSRKVAFLAQANDHRLQRRFGGW